MALTNIVKAVPIDNLWFAKEVTGIDHIFVATDSGNVIDLQPSLGIARRISAGYSDGFLNLKLSYSHTQNLFYFYGYDFDILEYNPQSGATKTYSYATHVATYVNSLSNESARAFNFPHYIGTATDGNLYFGNIRFRGVCSLVKFDTSTKEFTFSSILPDREFEFIHGTKFCPAFKIDTGAFAGVYARMYWYDDSYTSIRSQIEAEAVASGLTWTNANQMWVHWDDRDAASLTRRVFTPIGAGETWKFVDLLSPSTWLNSQKSAGSDDATAYGGTFITETSAPVSKAGWSTIQDVKDFAADIGYTVPAYDPIIMYSKIRGVGRYAYNYNYLANKAQFFTFGYSLTTGEAIYTDAFDKATTFVDNGELLEIYLCNFGGAFGFSSDPEYVGFTKNEAGNYCFIRPDTDTWVEYNITTDPSGYKIAKVSWDDPSDVNAPGHYLSIFGSFTQFQAENETWNKASDSTVKPALNENIIQLVDENLPVADLTFQVTHDYNYTRLVKNLEVKGIPTINGTICQAIEDSANNIIVSGQRYSGTVTLQKTGASTFTTTKYFADGISPDGMKKFAPGKYLIYGYLGTSKVIDVSTWGTPTQVSSTNKVQEIGYMDANRTDCVLLQGNGVRLSLYQTGYLYLIRFDTSTYVQVRITALPSVLNIQETIDFRKALGLTDTTHTDAEVENAIQAYILSTGESRAQVIARFTGACKYDGRDIASYGTKTVIGLNRREISALRTINVEDTPGSGIWYTETYGQSTDYPAAAYFDIADVEDLTAGDVKIVEFQVAGLQGTGGIGRVGVSDNYIYWLKNDPTNSRAIVRAVTKTNFEAAAAGSGIITSFDKTIYVSTGSTSNTYGFGDADKFEVPSTTYQSNAFLAVGDKIYATIRSNVAESGTYPAVIEIDLSAGTYRTFATRNASTTTKSISYNATTDRMLVSQGTSLFVIDNFSLVSPPIALA